MLIKRGIVVVVLGAFPTLQRFVINVSVVGASFILSVLNDRYNTLSLAKEVIHSVIFSLAMAPFLIVTIPSKKGEIYPRHWSWFRRVWVTLSIASVLFFIDWKYELMFFRW